MREVKRTGWPPGLLQDDSRELSRWFASRIDARRCVRERVEEIEVFLEGPIAVLAGTYEQFQQYKREHPGKNLRYCDRFEDIVGARFSGVVEVGTFWERPDSAELANHVATRLEVAP